MRNFWDTFEIIFLTSGFAIILISMIATTMGTIRTLNGISDGIRHERRLKTPAAAARAATTDRCWVCGSRHEV